VTPSCGWSHPCRDARVHHRGCLHRRAVRGHVPPPDACASTPSWRAAPPAPVARRTGDLHQCAPPPPAMAAFAPSWRAAPPLPGPQPRPPPAPVERAVSLGEQVPAPPPRSGQGPGPGLASPSPPGSRPSATPSGPTVLPNPGGRLPTAGSEPSSPPTLRLFPPKEYPTAAMNW
jgi:hypothetical protein